MKKTPDSNDRSPLNNSKDASAATQRRQILALIQKYQSVNTLEFRKFGIMAPAVRIFELKQRGHLIEKVLETDIDDAGVVHPRVARYYSANNPPANDRNNKVAA